MRVAPYRFAWLPLLLCAGVAAGTHVPQTSGGSIVGTVTAQTSGEPIADATVTLYAPGLPDNHIATTTDSRGEFTFDRLDPGRYIVGVSKAGFATFNYGQRRYGGSGGGRAIPLGVNERRELRLRLGRLGAITGTVTDDRGRPLANALVRALHFSLAAGYPRAYATREARTDAGGVYRVDSLAPDDYIVCASTSGTAPLDFGQRLQLEIDQLRQTIERLPRTTDADVERARLRLAEIEPQLPARVDPVQGYAPACHTDSARERSSMAIGPDEERRDMAFQLASTRLARIIGTVSGASPISDSANRVRLVNEDEGLGDLREGAAVTGRGRFFLKNVPPGRYLLILNAGRRPGPGAAPSHVLAATPITVTNHHQADLAVPVPPGATVEGRVVFQGRGVVDPGLVAQTHVNLQSTVAGALMRHLIYVARPDVSGRFEFSNVLPGSYQIHAWIGAPSTWFADSVAVDGASDELGSIVIKPGQRVPNVVATLTDRRATLVGTIRTESGEPASEYLILVYPVEERYWTAHTHRMHVTRASQDGDYVIEGIRPGRYRVATLLDVDFGAWFEPAFLRQLESTSMTVSIAGNERETLPLRVP